MNCTGVGKGRALCGLEKHTRTHLHHESILTSNAQSHLPLDVLGGRKETVRGSILSSAPAGHFSGLPPISAGILGATSKWRRVASGGAVPGGRGWAGSHPRAAPATHEGGSTFTVRGPKNTDTSEGVSISQ